MQIPPPESQIAHCFNPQLNNQGFFEVDISLNKINCKITK